MIKDNWPCSVDDTYLFKPYVKWNGPFAVNGSPQRGLGDRCLYCEHYGRCLDFAAGRDWEAFNCQSCPYAQRAGFSFRQADFEAIEYEQDEDLVFCSEAEMDRLLGPNNRQEDNLIAIITEGVFDER